MAFVGSSAVSSFWRTLSLGALGLNLSLGCIDATSTTKDAFREPTSDTFSPRPTFDSKASLPPKTPQTSSGSLVSLAPSITETLLAISPDLAPRIVGVTAFDDSPEVKHASKIGGYGAPSLEAVLALSPELVLAEDIPATRHRLDELRAIGLSVATFPLETTSAILSSVEKIGEAVGKPEEGKNAASRLNQRLKSLQQKQSAANKTPRAVLVIGWEPLVVAGKSSYPSEILALAGMNNALNDASVAYPVLSFEALLALSPQVIVDAASHGKKSGRATFLKLLQSDQKIRVIEVSDAILRPGPRIAEAGEELWEKLHGQR